MERATIVKAVIVVLILAVVGGVIGVKKQLFKAGPASHVQSSETPDGQVPPPPNADQDSGYKDFTIPPPAQDSGSEAQPSSDEPPAPGNK